MQTVWNGSAFLEVSDNEAKELVAHNKAQIVTPKLTAYDIKDPSEFTKTRHVTADGIEPKPDAKNEDEADHAPEDAKPQSYTTRDMRAKTGRHRRHQSNHRTSGK